MDHGIVYLIGAGPGDPGLLTVKAVKAIEKSDVIVYDRLANPAFLKYNKKAEKIYVGKKSSDHTMSQEDISNLIMQLAKEGKTVARLKGGDPYVFGRGGEEAEVLFENDVKFEVIPGITSGIGGLAYAGIPITHRDHASSLHLITGHLKSDDESLDFEALSRLDGTMVFYMGVSNLERIASGLLKGGKDGSTPVAIISWATHPQQKTIITSLSEISEKGIPENVISPSLIAVGSVIGLRNKLDFFEKKLLHGKRIIVTRARAQSSSLVERLEDLGAMVIECPSIIIEKINEDILKKEIENIKDYTHLAFTSQNAVNIFMQELLKTKDARALSHLRICSIGEATSNELKKYSLNYDLMPERFIAEELAGMMLEDIDENSRILIPRAVGAREILVELLSQKCYVNEIKIYEAKVEKPDEDVLEQLKMGADYITFTSSSTVSNFYQMIDEDIKSSLKSAKLISIGPITSATIEEMGYKVTAEAERYDIDGVIDSVIKEEISCLKDQED